jgi:hypothetical protein
LRVNPIAILGCVDRKQFDYISIKAVPVKRTVSRRRGSRNQLEIATVASHSERLASHVSLLPKGNDPFPLGSLDHNPSQEYWATGGRRDLEEDLAESGIADHDGLLEQIGSPDCMALAEGLSNAPDPAFSDSLPPQISALAGRTRCTTSS